MSDETSPKPINRKVALKLAASVLFERARILGTRTSNEAFRRRGHEAASNAASKNAGRTTDISRLRFWANILETAWQAKKVEGDGVDAAVLGYLLAVLSGDDKSIPELRAELKELDVLAPSDIDAVPGGLNGIPLWIWYILGVDVN